MTPLFAGTLHGFGLPVVAGGAGRFVAAFRSLLGSLGVRVETGVEVDRILVAQGRAVGVAAAGRTFRALRRTRLGDAECALRPPPPGGRGRLRPAGRGRELPVRPGGAADPCRAVGAARLRDPRLAEIPLIHLSDGSAGTGIACAEAEAGLLPRHPTVVVGRQYLLDPARVPAGAAALWLQLQEVPFAPRGDAAGELDTTHGWTKALAKGYADCVLDRIAARPRSARQDPRIDVLTPDDLRDRNPNAVSGDPYGGSASWTRACVASTRLVGPPCDPGRPALAHRRLDPPGCGSRRRLRTSRRDHADRWRAWRR